MVDLGSCWLLLCIVVLHVVVLFSIICGYSFDISLVCVVCLHSFVDVI